jgi:hypothetical protein
VAQGWEAGGHNYGGLPIMVLVPEILDTVSPALVLASGGIVDGRGVAAARGLLPLYAKLTPTRSAAMIRAPLFAEPCGDRSGWYIADAEMRDSERAAKANLPYATNSVELLSSGPRSCLGQAMPFSAKSSRSSAFCRFPPFKT